MMETSRRRLLSTSAVVCALAVPLPFIAVSCSTSSATTLEQAKLYGDDLANAVSAAAQVYLAGPPAPSAANAALVKAAVADLQTAKAALDGTHAETDAVGVINQIIAGVQTVSPIVAPFLGLAAPYLPLALAVLQAFINRLPPPADAPPVPPAGLHRAAMAYRRH